MRRELTPGLTKGTFPVCHLLVEWHDRGFQVVEDCPANDAREVFGPWPNLLLYLTTNRLLLSYKLCRYFSMFPCFFQLTFPTRLSFPENGPWHDRFSRSKGQSDVPKCDQWPPRQPPKEVLMLTHLRASAPITTCCLQMLLVFYVELKASSVRTSESTLVLSSRQNEDMSWNVYASNVDHLIFDIKHRNKS